MTYDTTGQVLQVTNPRGHTRTFSYADNFYTDANPPVNPPATFTPAAPTNAFPTLMAFNESQGSGHLHWGYYFGSGKIAREQDTNLADIFHHYVDPLDRETHKYDRKLTNGTRGWTLTVYSSSTQTDTYRGITSTTAATNCTSCEHTQTIVDGFGRHTRSVLVSDPDGSTITDFGYDADDRLQTQFNPYRTTTEPTYGIETTAYDGLNRTIQQTHADNNSVRTYFGAAVSTGGGNTAQLCSTATYGLAFPTLTVDEAGKKQQTWADAFGNIIETDEPDSTNSLTLSTCYLHDSLDNVIQSVQGAQTRSYTFDGISRLTSSAQPESGTLSYFYTSSTGSICSGAGDVCRKTDARGVTTTYTYDIGTERDRITQISYSDGTPTVQYFYDQASYNGLTITFGGNRRTGMSDGSGQTAWSYDPYGHIVTERRTIGTVTKTTSYSYNLDGSVSSKTYPSGRTVAYTYNNAARPISAVDTANHVNYALNATYAPQGSLSSAIFGQVTGGFTGITRAAAYNNRLQPTGFLASSTNGTVQDLSYSYDQGGGVNDGNVASITNNLDTGRTQTFTYDPMKRLTSAKSSATTGTDCWGESYGYDRYGNLLAVNVTQCTAESLNVSVNNNNQITNSGFSYDAAGNMTSDGNTTYSWDAENRPKTAGTTSYTYDGDNWRVKQSTNELYWYDVACTHEILDESDSAGSVTDEYIYLGDQRIAHRDSSGAVSFYFDDRLGSARLMTTATGAVQHESDYYPFGVERVVNNTSPMKYKFTGKLRDADTGMDYSFKRMYNPALGRWLSSDPMRGRLDQPQTHNRYGYVADNPGNALDPNGLFIVPICVAFIAPCRFPPNKQLCSYYDDLILHGDACDKRYARTAVFFCKNSSTECAFNCARKCLIDQEPRCHFFKNCVLRDGCRVGAHEVCFSKCAAIDAARIQVRCILLFLPDLEPPGFDDPFFPF